MSPARVPLSRSACRSLWREHRVHEDRLETDTHAGTLRIPCEHVERVEVRDSDVKALRRGDLRLRGFRPALTLDWANFTDHVVLDESAGTVRRLRFAPEDPAAFRAAALEAAARGRRAREDPGGPAQRAGPFRPGRALAG